ncbi:MAG TPA: DUF2207 domain-containing protein [Steroidobacteraceae bacterium]|nr:DUF2207 domain-containing protein [Steroidobacteraceae bacterium]HRX88456.1 DUF2207 domain-containing protein [Steroidobacteraceae bacterium]
MRRAHAARVVGLLALLAAQGLAFAAERIIAFDSVIEVRSDSELEVREAIVVEARGENIRRGIYRDFPTRYRRANGERVVVGFEILYVQRNGAIEKFRLESIANGRRVYIGDPERLIPPGIHTYVIAYRTDTQLGFFADHDELYWNVTGNGWAFPIETVSAEVRLPRGIDLDLITAVGYTGVQGATGSDLAVSLTERGPSFRSTRSLALGEGLTIAVSWPKGVVSPPTRGMRLRYMLRDSWLAFLVGAGLLTLLAYYLYAWSRVGRDPPARVTVPHYQGPAGHSAAAMRYVRRMAYDQRCFATGILSLAVKGVISIAETETGLFGLKKLFVLHRTERSPLNAALTKDELALFDTLIGTRSSLVLQQENHATLRAARSAHEASLQAQYKGRLFNLNTLWYALGLVIAILFAVVALMAGQAQGFNLSWLFSQPAGWATLAMLVAGVVAAAVFGKLLRAPTLTGRPVLDQIEGYKMYLSVAEGDALKLVDTPPLTNELFELNLPAALALGVEQRWAERFAQVFSMRPVEDSPAWYSGDSWRGVGRADFAVSFGSSFTNAISAASSPPGSSSGGGGGGSSGGGGGGGGGGGW